MNKPIDVFHKSDLGLRPTRNEDASDIVESDGLYLVADGMGGPGGGDIASALAIETFKQTYPDTTGNSTERVMEALVATNSTVLERGQDEGIPHMGTTLAGVLLTPDNQVTVFNIGDTRVYRLRGREIEQLSYDHVQPSADGEHDGGLSQYLGMERPLQPSIDTEPAHDGDVYVICTDGLWRLVPPEDIRAAVRGVPAEQATNELVERARARGAPDNVTVLVCRLGPPPANVRRWLLMASAALLAVIVLAILVVLLSGGDDSSANSGGEVVTLAPTSAALDDLTSLSDRCQYEQTAPSDYVCHLQADDTALEVPLPSPSEPLKLQGTVNFSTHGRLSVLVEAADGQTLTIYVDTSGEWGTLSAARMGNPLALDQPHQIEVEQPESGDLMLWVDQVALPLGITVPPGPLSVSLQISPNTEVRLDNIVVR